MKAFIVICALFVTAFAAEEHCYTNIVAACKSPSTVDPDESIPPCNATYGAIMSVLPRLQTFTNEHIAASYEYLLMSTHYANYEKSREGFEKFFHELSDSKWNTAIDLIKYITKRGGEMKFQVEDVDFGTEKNELYELQSMAKSLDMEKSFANTAHRIHDMAARRLVDLHDPEISSFIEEKFVHKQASLIRKISGYVTDLTKLLNNQRGTTRKTGEVLNEDASLSLHFFDEFLAKA